MANVNGFTGPPSAGADEIADLGTAEKVSPEGTTSATQDAGENNGGGLKELIDEITIISTRLDSLVEIVSRLLEVPAASGDTAETSKKGGIGAAEEALIYATFFQAAVQLGMSPEMVSDAFRLADFADVTVNLETKEVTGMKEVTDTLIEKKPYLFSVRPVNVGSETNPLTGSSSFSPQVEGLAQVLGVSPQFAAELVKKRSAKAGEDLGIPEIWRIPRASRLSYLDSKE